MCQEALDLERSNGRERTESKCRKDEDLDMQYGSGSPAEIGRVSMRCLSLWSGKQQHLLQQLQAVGAQEMQWAQALDKGPDYRCTWCQGTARPLDGRPQRKVQVGPNKLEVVASFCYLAGGCELPTTTCEKPLEEVQRAATSSLFTPPLFQDMWPCSSVWRHVEHSNVAVKTAFHIQVEGKHIGLGGQRWHGSRWQRGIAENGSSWLSTLMIDIHVLWDAVRDLPCLQKASYLQGNPLMWMLPLYLHVNPLSAKHNCSIN